MFSSTWSQPENLNDAVKMEALVSENLSVGSPASWSDLVWDILFNSMFAVYLLGARHASGTQKQNMVPAIN